MLNQQKNSTSGEISQSSQVAFFKTHFVPARSQKLLVIKTRNFHG